MINAKIIRNTITEKLEAYWAHPAHGADAYCSETLYHPMAEAKYLMVLQILYETNLLSGSRFELLVSQACERLAESAIPQTPGDGSLWGLGFVFREQATNEPYLITSALVTHALELCLKSQAQCDTSTPLLDSALQGLASWFSTYTIPIGGALDFPVYSPGIREPVLNSATYAASILLAFDKQHKASAVLDWVVNSRVNDVGWLYAPNNFVIDLLHQCYILNSLRNYLAPNSIERFSAETLSLFLSMDNVSDSVKLVSSDQASPNDPFIKRVGNHKIQAPSKKARLWSLGEALVLCTWLTTNGQNQKAWRKLSLHFGELVVRDLNDNSRNEGNYPRHIMHALHGLASLLQLLRSSQT